MDVTFPHDQIRLSLYLHLELVGRIEQHPVTNLHTADIVAHAQDVAPRETVADLGRRWYNDAAAGTSLPFFARLLHQQAVVQELNLQFVIVVR